ncbi:MAG: acyl-CoA dehydrogenase [Deltaproteobacteria bacterium]|nr:acyl-CoA dehydrogenase [Deltaproteobacteria bacterium]
MAVSQLVDSRDVRFTLFEMLEVEKLNRFDAFKDFDRSVYEDTLKLAEKIAFEQFFPSNVDGDRIGLKFDAGKNEVKVPESFQKAFQAYLEAGFHILQFPQDMGGMGIPNSVSTAASEYFNAGNTALTMYCGSITGAIQIIQTFGSEEVINMFVPKMMEGKWGGTMCLTEPSAGSDLGPLKTKAVKQSDGTYLISGQKIFISNGEQDMTENIIHPVLARIEGDPDGTKGISIFVVPKYLVNPDGTLGERNDVVCAGIEHKMGLKGNATSTLNFGENGKCIGYLLGKEREGMKVMFMLMNAARIHTGLQAEAVSSAAYMHAVDYAKDRIQGTHILQSANKSAPRVAIIEHPDVKRMLLYMKSSIEGMRMLCYFLSHHEDIMHASTSEDEKKESMGIVEILTPIVKAGISDAGWLVTAEAIQVFGGYGYCQEYPVEQYARDVKVFSIYEGTNAIQSLDLLMRKMLMNPDMFNYKTLKKYMEGTIAKAKGVVEDKYIEPVAKGMKKLDEIVEMMAGQLMGGQIVELVSNATPLQQAMYPLILAWLHLWSLTITLPKAKALIGDAKGEDLKKLLQSNPEAAYYNGRVLSSQFFIGAEYPKFFGRVDCIMNNEASVVNVEPEIFS